MTSVIRSILRVIGSLWFAVVLLALLMVAMASATVYESSHGTERALEAFYHARWFQVLLALIAANILSALACRYPFSWRQAGFVLTHTGILLLLAGALITDRLGVDGQVAIGEGESVREFHTRRASLTAMNLLDRSRSSIDLGPSAIGGFTAVDWPATGVLRVNGLEGIAVKKYLPDMIQEERVLDDGTVHSPAVEVSLSPNGRDGAVWMFAGDTVGLGFAQGTLRLVSDGEELDRLMQPRSEEEEGEDSPGIARIDCRGETFELPVEDCTEQAVPLGDTGLRFRVLRYMPHAVVGGDQGVGNASPEPLNPAIEVEIEGPSGTETRLAFSMFPDFEGMHQATRSEDLKVAFLSSAAPPPSVPVEVLRGPEGALHVRFHGEGAPVVHRSIEVGLPVDTPWPGLRFCVLRCFENARIETAAVQPDPVRERREPALLVELRAEGGSREVWLPRHRVRAVEAGGSTFQLLYGDRAIPLGFELTLNRFRVGRYPGGDRPRTFESHVTITDPQSGGKRDRIISMNSPVKYGGYSLFQSSYDDQGGRTVSYLSVSRDPGQPIAFAGYVATTLGMLIVLGMRLGRRRLQAPAQPVRLTAEVI